MPSNYLQPSWDIQTRNRNLALELVDPILAQVDIAGLGLEKNTARALEDVRELYRACIVLFGKELVKSGTTASFFLEKKLETQDDKLTDATDLFLFGPANYSILKGDMSGFDRVDQSIFGNQAIKEMILAREPAQYWDLRNFKEDFLYVAAHAICSQEMPDLMDYLLSIKSLSKAMGEYRRVPEEFLNVWLKEGLEPVRSMIGRYDNSPKGRDALMVLALSSQTSNPAKTAMEINDILDEGKPGSTCLSGLPYKHVLIRDANITLEQGINLSRLSRMASVYLGNFYLNRH